MSLKASVTTADYLPWDEMVVLTQKLERDNKYMLALLIAVGSFTGLRVSDLLRLTWEQIIGKTHLSVTEHKTKKNRTIKINQQLSDTVERIFKSKGGFLGDIILMNPKTKKAYSVQYLNRALKALKFKYRLTIKRFSTHTMRKTFGRRIWEGSGYSERAITMLSEMFNHSSFRITRRYLGINQQEIEQVYDLL